MHSSVVHMLWVEGSFTNLETRCIKSFLQRGYRVALWTYRGVNNVPSGADVRDAREVLPESAIFLNLMGSYAGFSDLFRYAVLRKHGGLYSDVDVVALQDAAQLPSIPFLVTERRRDGGVKINGNVIHVPQAQVGSLIDLAFAYANVFPKDRISWSEIGPDLLTAIASIHTSHGFGIMPPEFANPINWWDCPHALLAATPAPPSFFLHLYNDMWRRAGADKNAPYPPDSLLSTVLPN